MDQHEPSTEPAGRLTLAYSTSGPADETALRSVDLFTIALQLLGIYELIVGIPAIFYIPAIFTGRSFGVSPGLAEVLTWLLPAAFPLAIGVLLLTGARWIARRLLGGARDAARGLRPPGKRLQAVAFAVVGILVFIEGGVDSARMLVRWFGGVSDNVVDDSYFLAQSGLWPSLVPGAIQIVAGAFLFFGAKSLAGYWHRLRTEPNPFAGTAAQVAPADEHPRS